MGVPFLKEKYNLHKSEKVASAAERTKKQTGESVPQKPAEQIQNYLDRFQEILDREDETERKRGIAAIKKVLHDKYVIDHVPEAHLELQRRIAREAGQGADLPDEYSEKQLASFLEVIQTDQKESLNLWIDYLSGPDALYPNWAKYWMMRSVLTMSAYDKEKSAFGVRTDSTVAPFPDLNHEALAYAVDAIQQLHSPDLIKVEEQIRQQNNLVKKAKSALRKNPEDVHVQEGLEQAETKLAKLRMERDSLRPQNPVQAAANEFAEEGKRVSDEEFDHILNTKDFPKYYAFAIEHVVADNSELFKITDGEWRVFEQGSDPKELTKTLQGHGTGWCTAGTSTAEAQLSKGDFHVFYSKNDLGEAKIPRLAIRMQGEKMVEVRGVAHQQEIDPYIAPILEKKMDEFGEQGEEYKEKAAMMKRLTAIESKVQSGGSLNQSELRFLYEIDQPIRGFGYGNSRDERIYELLEGRDQLGDLMSIFGLDSNGDKLAQALLTCGRADLLMANIDRMADPGKAAILELINIDIKTGEYHKQYYEHFIKNAPTYVDIDEEVFVCLTEKLRYGQPGTRADRENTLFGHVPRLLGIESPQQLAIALIKAGKVSLVYSHWKTFAPLNLTRELFSIVKNHSIGLDIDNFLHKYEKLPGWIVEEEMAKYGGIEWVIKNRDRIQGLSFNKALMSRMLDLFSAELEEKDGKFASNDYFRYELKLFTGLDKEVFYRLLELGFAREAIASRDRFVDMDFETEVGKIEGVLRSKHDYFSLVRYAELLPGVSLNKNFALEILENYPSGASILTGYIEKFSGLDGEVAWVLLRKGSIHEVLRDSDQFSGFVLNDEVAQFVLNSDHYDGPVRRFEQHARKFQRLSLETGRLLMTKSRTSMHNREDFKRCFDDDVIEQLFAEKTNSDGLVIL